MHIAMLSPIAWRTPPRHYGPWESVVSSLTEGLVKRNIDVTLFATGDSVTQAKLKAVCPHGYEEDSNLIPKVGECLHISALFEQAEQFDLIHNHFDYLPLTYSAMTSTPLVTTIHGFSSPGILPVYQKYNKKGYYISISDADRSPTLSYLATVHHGIDLSQFTFQAKADKYLLFMGRIHNDKGVRQAIDIAKRCNTKLLIAGIIQDRDYYQQFVHPELVADEIEFLGEVDPLQRNKLLGGAAALLHPIQFNEPFGLSVIEAMACGTPVIAFNRGSMPELIQHGLNGFLVENVEQAVTAVGRLKELDRMQCRTHVERFFDVERMVDDYVNLYQKITEQTARDSHRPWGYYKVLADKPRYKSKEIVVFPGKRLSLQKHRHRTEHWLILEGSADVVLGKQIFQLVAGQSVDIPVGTQHRIANPSNNTQLRFIEVQTGEYFGEDDIERIEDDFGRG